MKELLLFCVAGCSLLAWNDPKPHPHPSAGWVSLFDGKTLDGWKVGENAETFSVENGTIIAHGKTAHLFYMGDVGNHDFKNFDFKADVMNPEWVSFVTKQANIVAGATASH